MNGTLADEAGILRLCLHSLGVGAPKQVAESLTGLGFCFFNSVGEFTSFLRDKLPGLQDETVDDFLEKNAERHPVAPQLTLNGQLHCVTEDEFRSIFQNGNGWERFRQQFPDTFGYVEFSRVG